MKPKNNRFFIKEASHLKQSIFVEPEIGGKYRPFRIVRITGEYVSGPIIEYMGEGVFLEEPDSSGVRKQYNNEDYFFLVKQE